MHLIFKNLCIANLLILKILFAFHKYLNPAVCVFLLLLLLLLFVCTILSVLCLQVAAE